MDSEKKCEDLKKILEPEKNKSSTITQLDIDIWNLELRTNNVCLDEYTVGERLKHLRYLEELNRGRTQSFEAREEACLVREMVCEKNERSLQMKEAAIAGRQSMNDLRAALNYKRETKNSERENLNNEREEIIFENDRAKEMESSEIKRRLNPTMSEKEVMNIQREKMNERREVINHERDVKNRNWERLNIERENELVKEEGRCDEREKTCAANEANIVEREMEILERELKNSKIEKSYEERIVNLEIFEARISDREWLNDQRELSLKLFQQKRFAFPIMLSAGRHQKLHLSNLKGTAPYAQNFRKYKLELTNAKLSLIKLRFGIGDP